MTGGEWFVTGLTIVAGFPAGVVARRGADWYRQASGQRARWQQIGAELRRLIEESDPKRFLPTYYRLLRQLCGWTLRQFATAVISLGPVAAAYFATSAIWSWHWQSELCFLIAVAAGSFSESRGPVCRFLSIGTTGRRH